MLLENPKQNLIKQVMGEIPFSVFCFIFLLLTVTSGMMREMIKTIHCAALDNFLGKSSYLVYILSVLLTQMLPLPPFHIYWWWRGMIVD